MTVTEELIALQGISHLAANLPEQGLGEIGWMEFLL